MQKCSGRWCTVKEKCLHYQESRKNTKVKGRYINSQRCSDEDYPQLKVKR